MWARVIPTLLESTPIRHLTVREWLETQHKDTFASFLGHSNLVKYVSVATGECSARTRLNLLTSMLVPLVKQHECEPTYQPEFLSGAATTVPKPPVDDQGEEDMALD
ncbi:Splicing factor 3b subunit 5 [Paramicrosporidium saccamoebae]|uniref:Splicing factor 3b subunit 5 n=1 Tax=Paramicrosporidium saccamoebae TaxID=1246581 RepID=A0A2H9TIY7_9FUNG|nr:Splicing factor 3b subunit 5 [Paramicrosporidium saccamoebae]